MASRSRLAFLVALIALLAALALLRFTWPAKSPSGPTRAADLPTEVKEVDTEHPPVESLPAATGRVPVTAESFDKAPSRPHTQSGTVTGLQGIHLTGSVTASSGATVSGRDPQVELTDDSGEHHQVRIENGRYDFVGLGPGEYVLGCSIRGFDALSRPIALRAEELVREEDLVLEPAWLITVHVVTPDGQDLGVAVQKKGGPDVLLYSILSTVQRPANPLPPLTEIDRSLEGVSRNISKWKQGRVREDRLQILVEPPIYVSVVIDNQVLATQRVDVRIKEMTFTIDLERVVGLLSGLTVRIQDGETGEPATDALVILKTETSSEVGLKPDAEGIVRLMDRIPGNYELRASMKGRATERRSAQLESGKTTDLGTITLTTGTLIEGQCVDPDGTPRRVAAALIPLRASGSGDLEMWDSGYPLPMDEQGHFAVSNLSSDRYVVRIPDWISGQDYEGYDQNWTCPSVLVDTRRRPARNVVVVVQRPVPVVIRPRPREPDGTRFRILTPERLPCEFGVFQGSAPEHVDLAAGAYLLSLTRTGQGSRESPFIVGPAPVSLDLSRQ
jgi:hypothetical protein